MKTALALFVLVLLTPLLAPGQTSTSNRTAQVETELRGLVRSWDDAYVKSDTATLDRLLADEFGFVGGPKKAEYLASFKSRPANSVASALSADI